MKKHFYFLCVLVAFFFTFNAAVASVPKKITYQVLVLDQSNGSVRANANVAIRIEVRKGSATGEVAFGQDFNTQTDKSGVCSIALNIPENTDWSNGNFYFVTLIDGKVTGTSQITSVPYAMYAEKAERLNGDPTREELVGTWICKKSEFSHRYNETSDYDYSIVLNTDGTGSSKYERKRNGEYNGGERVTFNWHLASGGVILLTSRKYYSISNEGTEEVEEAAETLIQHVVKIEENKMFFSEFEDKENLGNIFTKQ